MQPDCDLLPIKGMFVSQLNPPPCVLFLMLLLCKMHLFPRFGALPVKLGFFLQDVEI